MTAWMSVVPALALGRHGPWAAKFAQSPKMRLAAATFFACKADEDFVACGSQPDGTVVAFGNSWGPRSPSLARVTVLGKGDHRGLPLHPGSKATDRRGRPLPPSPLDPDIAGMVVFFSKDLRRVMSVVRFEWGVANISTGRVLPDGDLLLGGVCTERFRTFAGPRLKVFTAPAEGQDFGPVDYSERVRVPGDVYVARLGPDATSLRWAWVFEGHRSPPDALHLDPGSRVVADIRGVKRIEGDGSRCEAVELRGSSGRVLRLMAVSPKTGLMLRCGEKHHGTGREPWRRPLFFAHAPDGSCAWSAYDWPGPLVGHDRFRLVSDSVVRLATFDPNGEIVFYGWSDGGNSVFTRSPIDLTKPVPKSRLGMSGWGVKGAKSFAHIVRFDPETFQVKDYLFWASYMTSSPNSSKISRLLPLSNGCQAIAGASASFLVQTPNAWYKVAEGKPAAGRGNYVTVFNRDWSNALFSSALPCCTNISLAEVPGGLLVASRCEGAEKIERNEVTGQQVVNRPPVLDAPQPRYGGGRADAHIILLSMP